MKVDQEKYHIFLGNTGNRNLQMRCAAVKSSKCYKTTQCNGNKWYVLI